MSTLEATGSCLCGAVSFATRALDSKAGACHCDICRRWGGGPLLALDGGADVRFEGADRIVVYDSSRWAERGFCSACGTHLFIRVKGNGRYIMPAGLFPVEAELRFDHQIFIDKKPAYYDFANETKRMTGAEVFAEHGPTSE
jgi:hypothetical protein